MKSKNNDPMPLVKQFFKIQELVPQHVFEERGFKAWELLDERALLTLFQLRVKFGPTIINNWHTGGNFQWSGLRTEQSPYGSQYSQHRFGRAFDCKFTQTTAEEAREYVLKNLDQFPYITAIEDEVSWFHFDCRNCPRVKVFKP